MAQSRKKAIMEQVEKQRRRNRAISLAAIVIIAVIITAVVLYPRGGNAVNLPGYLDHCVTSTLLYHAHPSLSIVMNGSSVTIPALVGLNGSCFKPLHTHATDGIIHVETDQDRDYTLGDFFLIWGNWADNPTQAIFTPNQIFGAHAVAPHNLTMTVNGAPEPSFQNYVIPRTASSSSAACTPGPCQTITIAITYT